MKGDIMNNYYYQNYNWNPSLNRNNNIPNLFSPTEGFQKGNLFSNLYSEYKNYQPDKLKANNNQEQKLLTLQTIAFAAHDLNLYLDIHPEDQSIVELFNDYKRQLIELTNEYEIKYGPITVNSNNSNGFTWEKSPWPWEGYNV